MLSRKEKATLTNKLQVSTVVTDILDGRAVLSDDVHYALHETISDLQPDSALLAVALSAEKISRIYESASTGMQILRLECERIIEDYGSLWLQNARHENMDGEALLDTLLHTPEDLESVAELLELNIVFLKDKDKTAATICEILLVQSKAHALIAEEFIGALSAQLSLEKRNPMPMPTVLAGNVVPFPAHHRAG